MRTAVLALVLCSATACTSTVTGEGRLAADVVVPPTARTTTAPPTTPTVTPPTVTRTPVPTPAPTSSAAPGVPAVPAAYAGTWRGTMNQPNSAIPAWTAVLQLPRGGGTGSFQVRGYCSGSVLVVAASAAQLVLIEVIRSDPSGRCAAGGTIQLTPAGAGRLRMRWIDSAVRTNVATGTLARG